MSPGTPVPGEDTPQKSRPAGGRLWECCVGAMRYERVTSSASPIFTSGRPAKSVSNVRKFSNTGEILLFVFNLGGTQLPGFSN